MATLDAPRLDAPLLDAPAALPGPARVASLTEVLGGFYRLTKPNLSALVMASGVLGYALATRTLELPRLIHLIVGLWCTSGGAGALNMYLERSLDARMRRTRGRPIPAGLISPAAGLAFSIGLFIFGFAVLQTFTTPLTAYLGAVTMAIYAFVYTPLKARGPVAIWVGAIPGAVPPLMGWAAASGSLAWPAWALFGVMFLWQFPHFLALAWMYREDYARGGFEFLPAGERSGEQTARAMLLGAALLVPVTLTLQPLRVAGTLYSVGALVLGLWFVGRTVGMVRRPGTPEARRVFFASIIYLPVMLVLIVIDRWLGLA